MTNVRKVIALTASVTIAAVTLGAGIASAHTIRFDSNLTAHFTEVAGAPDISGPAGRDYFSGRVTSPKPACKANRLVRVYRKVPGPDPSAATRTNSDGRWRIESEDPPNDTYYAKTPKKVLRNTAAHTHICKRARSQDFVVAGQP